MSDDIPRSELHKLRKKWGMKNPIAVFLFSIDHKSRTLNRIFGFLGLYRVIRPFPFEHYCVFCAKTVSWEWWYSKEYWTKAKEKVAFA